jgi:hypothetical protein
MPSTSTPTSRTPTLPHKFTPGASHEQGYFVSQTPSSSAASTTIAVTTPFPLASSPGNTSPSTYYTPGGFPAQPEMLASLARLPPPPRLSLPTARYPSSEPSSPRVMTFHRAPSSSEVPSPMDRPRRSPPPMQSPNMTISSIPAKHTLHVQLPISIQPEMITISAQKGDKLKVVADAWHMESDCK